MITPNKAVTIEESALGLVGVIMKQGPEPKDLLSLYHSVSEQFESIDHFLLTIDVLYVLGRIDVDANTRTVTYAR